MDAETLVAAISCPALDTRPAPTPPFNMPAQGSRGVLIQLLTMALRLHGWASKVEQAQDEVVADNPYASSPRCGEFKNYLSERVGY